MRRHGFPRHPGHTEGTTSTCSLIHPDLKPEARQAAETVAMLLIGATGRRAAAVFLGLEDYEKVEHDLGGITANLMLECLQAFIEQRGGQTCFAPRLDPRADDVINPVQTSITVDGKTRQFLRCGFLFVHFPDERVVISAEPTEFGGVGSISVAVRSNRGSASFWDAWKDFARENNYLRGRSFFADGKIIERSHACNWEDILLPEETKRTIRTHVEGFLRNRLRLRGLGVKARRGLILAGPPGTGKTLLGKVLADTLDVSFMWVSPRHIQNPASFEGIMTLARFLAPVVVFLEDLDLFAEERETSRWMGLGELMNQLDGAADNEDIVTIATTNRLDTIEKALRNRPGRFDRIVQFDVMDVHCRRHLLRRRLRNASICEEDMHYLVEATDEYTGAEIEELSSTLYILAVQEDNPCLQGCSDGEPDCQKTANEAAEPISVDRPLIDAALSETRIERRGKLGFNVA